MLNLRSPLMLAVPPAGLALGAAAWLLLGSGNSTAAQAADLDARFAAVKPVLARAANGDAAAQAAIRPLFPTDAASQKEIVVVLQGLARTSRRQAALLSINGKPAQWIERGASQDGVTLLAVQDAKVMIETADGRKEIGLGEQPAIADVASPAGTSGELPPGVKLPPAPASAPGP